MSQSDLLKCETSVLNDQKHMQFWRHIENELNSAHTNYYIKETSTYHYGVENLTLQLDLSDQYVWTTRFQHRVQFTPKMYEQRATIFVDEFARFVS
uniref:DUF3630 family protein n=1 Tax=Loa loa TaxID=7209 RepID=A0A1I7W0K9_LOALO